MVNVSTFYHYKEFSEHFKLLESKLFIKTTMSIHRRKSEKKSMRLSYRGQDLPRSSTREVVMLAARVGVDVYEEALWRSLLAATCLGVSG